MMAKKLEARKRKELSNIENEFLNSYNKNFNIYNMNMRRPLPFTPNQTQCLYCINDPNTNMVFIDGLAGSNKTYLSVYTALEHLKEGKCDQVIYIRSVVESSSRSIGALPGELDEKFGPYILPLLDKLDEFVDKSTSKMLLENEYIKTVPVNFVRGLTFHDSFVIIDEAQNCTRSELTTILTRFGKNSKYIVCGDTNQCDIPDSGFGKIYELFNTEHSEKNNINCFKFDVDDVVRSPILKHITQVLGV